MPALRSSIQFTLLAACSLAAFCHAGTAGALTPDFGRLASGDEGKTHNRALTLIDKGGASAVRFDERAGDGLAWWPEVAFVEGVIEFDARGKDVFQRSFIGVAFHGADEKTFEAVYFRPFNFRSTDPGRRQHAVQYIAHPEFTWQRLRAERPEEFENPVEPPPDPNDWFHVRVTVAATRISVFVNDATEACLVATRLTDRKSGWVGLWVGNGSGGDFANLVIRPATKE